METVRSSERRDVELSESKALCSTVRRIENNIILRGVHEITATAEQQ
jgi:hypothetical protein